LRYAVGAKEADSKGLPLCAVIWGEIGEGMTTDPTFLTRGSRFPNEDVIVPTAFEIEKGSKS